MIDSMTVGLRERKRRETRERLERAAVEIAEEAGLEGLTVDAISDRADVSPRTFFNYFDSKEDALLGFQFNQHTQQAIGELARTMRTTSLVDGVLTLLMVFIDDSLHAPGLRDGRRKVLHQHPELLSRRFEQMSRLADSLAESVRILMERLQAEPDARAESDLSIDRTADTDTDPTPDGTQCRGTRSTDAHAQLVLMLCGAAVRAAMLALTHRQSELPPDQFTRLIHHKAAALVRETIEKLQ